MPLKAQFFRATDDVKERRSVLITFGLTAKTGSQVFELVYLLLMLALFLFIYLKIVFQSKRLFVCLFFSKDPFFKFPSNEEPIQDIFKYGLSDKWFAEQRLAGVNPMTLMRVTTDGGKYDDLVLLIRDRGNESAGNWYAKLIGTRLGHFAIKR